MNQNEISNSKSETGGKKITKKQQQPEMMMSELLSAISETEYPAYILEAAKIVQEWMNDAVNRNKHDADLIFFRNFSALILLRTTQEASKTFIHD